MSTTTSTTTTTTSQAPASYSVALKDKDTLTASFNYWGSTSIPQESDILRIFNGSSTELQRVQCPVTDIRALGLSSFNLSTHGFQVLRHSSALLPPQSDSVPDFHNTDLISATYWPELVSLLKAQLGVRSAAAVNTTVRDVKETDRDGFDPKNPRFVKQSMQPFFIVHGDYTPAGARAQLRAVVSTYFEDNNNMEGTTESERTEFFRLRDEIIAGEEEAMRQEGIGDHWHWSGKNYTGPRWAMLSVWRPLEPVRRDPLGVMDPRTLLQPSTAKPPYIALQRVYKGRPGFAREFRSENILAVAPDQQQLGNKMHTHQWYYISQQTPDEVYALKLFDSEAHRGRGDGGRSESEEVAQFVAHSAFTLPQQENERLRRSVEVRMMVIW
ncbi:uncharacterized protein A1O5_10081 [Cladophialophora psammophila CBS 110553]|uniref:GA4 desaturase n=1 Tax=Cladophialophora psammophila CBS 110553 TaxID=1182543 RepID=W9WQH2_9EURO|nr:uncharacterized protein A1O5_10081 [Cladophialophora psammophila CBS 110553]EXJ66886.1 hypothetical protein A1O5_10081 [Cladophialophora psammophila CBS 110553]